MKFRKIEDAPMEDPMLAMDPFNGLPMMPDLKSGVNDSIFQNKDFLKIIKEYHNDALIPSDALKRFWAFLGKSVLLSFAQREDLEYYDNMFEVAKLNFLMSMPETSFSWEMQTFLDEVKVAVYTNVIRSIGTEKDIKNERTMENTQISQSILSSGEGKKQGFIGGMMNKVM